MAETISISGTVGIVLSSSQNPLTVTASGSVITTSGYAIYGQINQAWTVDNFGTIHASNGYFLGQGIVFKDGGTVTNAAGGYIYGQFRGVSVGFVQYSAPRSGIDEINNAGTIISGGLGAGLGSGGTVINTGFVSAEYGIEVSSSGLNGVGGTIINAGTIIGTKLAVDLSGNLADRLVIDPNAVFIGKVVADGPNNTLELAPGSQAGTLSGLGTQYAGFQTITLDGGATWHFANANTIGGPSTLVDSGSLEIDGTLVNQGSINLNGVVLDGAGTLINSGRITGTGGGAYLTGGHITNAANGIISTTFIAVYTQKGASADVTNAGTLSGITGVCLGSGGSLNNSANADITGHVYGIVAYGAAVVTNMGTITGTLSGGIYLGQGGTISNIGGLIAGPNGITIKGSSGGTVVNAGTISGTSKAVSFADTGNNRLVIDPGAIFAGDVTANGVTNTLELAAGSGTLSGLGDVYIGFTAIQIDTGASWDFTATNTIGSGIALTNDGTMIVSHASVSIGAVMNYGQIDLDPSTVTMDDLTGAGVTTIEPGSTLTVTDTVASTETIVFSGTDDLLGANPTAFAGQINGFTIGDTIQLAGVTDGTTAEIVNGNTLQIDRSGNPPVDLTLDPTVSYTGDTFAVSPTGAVTETPCFVIGTLIRTDRGDVAVERLAIGDRVVTLSGSVRPIRWIGHRALDLTRHPDPRRVQPVFVRTDAFGEGMPRRDLFLSPEHAVLLNGVLVPVRLLVNGASIRRDLSRRRVTYYHVELETHDILLAEGLAVESYLETGNRGMFQNAGEPLLLHPDLTNDQACRVAQSCAPFADDPARVEPMWRALAERAAARGWSKPTAWMTTDDPALHLVVDGRRIAPIDVTRGKHVFLVPSGIAEVRLRSRATIPSDVTPWLADDRRLGVLLRGLAMQATPIPLDHPSFGTGWWAPEWHGPAILRRWTDGNAVLPMPENGPCLLEIDVATTLAYRLPAEAADTSPIRRSA